MEYTTTQINRDFLIKVYGYDADGKRINKLVGVSGLLLLIGVELANKLLRRAYKCNDVCHCKLRRGLKVSFYLH